MNYKQVIDRIFDNLHITKEGSKELKTVRNDIADSLIDAFGRSVQPRKEISYNIAETEAITEDFVDTTLIDGMVLTDVVVPGGTIAATEFGIIAVTGLSLVNTVGFTVAGTFNAIDVIGTVKVLSEAGEELFSDTFTQATYPETFSFNPAVSGVNLTLEVVIKAPTDMADCVVSDFNYSVDLFSVTLPDDFYVPLQVVFNSPDRRYGAKEMTREQYVSWNPSAIGSEDPSRLYDWDSINTIFMTEENIDYDRLIGFFFQQKGASAQLIFKPNFVGTIEVSYAYLPTIVAEDGTPIDINRRFMDLMIWGATLKEMVRRLTAPDINEAKLAGLQMAISKYNADYMRLLHEFTNFMSKRTEAARILPYSVLNDGYQDLEVRGWHTLFR